MKLGTQTGSLVNHLYANGTIGQPAPTVGMGATILGWTDRHAATINKVTELNSKVWQWEIEVTEDDAKVVSGSGHDGSAQYEYSPRPDRHTSIYRFNKKTLQWVHGFTSASTSRFVCSSGGIRIGERDHYRDPSF